MDRAGCRTEQLPNDTHFGDSFEKDRLSCGVRMRTVMVTNVPPSLRSERELKEYFEYYLSRHVAQPALGITSTIQPGFLNKSFTFLLNRLTDIPAHLNHPRFHFAPSELTTQDNTHLEVDQGKPDTPVIDRVILVRKMSELASLLERREEVLSLLETAHIKLAKRALASVSQIMANNSLSPGHILADEEAIGEERTELLIRTLGIYVSPSSSGVQPGQKRRIWHRKDWRKDTNLPSIVPHSSVWDALLSLPRSVLDAYQPLIHLSTLFRGHTVPSIDYYTAKLDLLTSLITEKRAQAFRDYEPTSTAFVTFADPADARRACKFLAVHPTNPLQCFVTMAPAYEDLDWLRLMKPSFRVEFVKDWLVNLGVWGFTTFWVFPVSILVGLVSIQNISTYWPGLETYLNNHEWEEELLQSFVPTVLVSLLSLLIPLILLLIAKKAHTIAMLSTLHDRIMTRYYKFLVVNVLIFFCVGTAALQSFLVSFTATSGLKVIQIVADSFPTAGPFYVGWYWLPNHMLAVHVLLMFAVLNPLVIPFAFIYFCVGAVVIKNQLLHVYAKTYEGNGQTILIRLIRYSCDGLILSQVVFMAYMVVLKITANVVVSAILIVLTASAKLLLTRICRARFERDDIIEADIVCGKGNVTEELLDEVQPIESCPRELHKGTYYDFPRTLPVGVQPRRFPDRIEDGYATLPRRPRRSQRRRSNPFMPPAIAKNSTSELEDITRTSLVPGSARGQPGNPKPDETQPVSSQAPLVVPHPPHPAWDDEPSPDRTYDNPYFARSIQDELWLPRDPLGILDLDDTVVVRRSLTSQPSSGMLGARRQDEFLSSRLSLLTDAASPGSLYDHSTVNSRQRRFNGNERIQLPVNILSRVGAAEKENDVETATYTQRPGPSRRRQYGSHSIHLTGELRYSDRDASLGLRYLSLGAVAPTGMHQRLSSFFAHVGRHTYHRHSPTTHQVNDISAASPYPPPAAATQFTADETAATILTSVSLREAMVEEAVEEEEAVRERLRLEEAEERDGGVVSQLISWMFAR
ncbi:uncharacterized protein FIBRA_01738 [Fibroporia radiculosa]|uniref:CSC1/OSCA1-like 7TM region domain-containing protein n=1 Tax=Fibroporia radiculosa TaxID=599839 RepID=J4I8N4_9APHY|nr:uncharacterized protein FIBRA_01738 [Fibroporia radiculosa]CCL99716.1 predicted protein [Fibroporia radiculosa]